MMDDATLEWLVQDTSVDTVSGTPLTAVVFMLYYSLELSNFLLNMSDHLVARYPLQVHHVGESSVYMAGSTAHGFFLNTHRFPEVRDFDIVSTLRKYPIHDRCEYDEPDRVPRHNIYENSHLRNNDEEGDCECRSEVNMTCGEDPVYLNVEPSHYPGYVLVRKCRRTNRPQTIVEKYVNSTAIVEGRLDFWKDAQSYILQQYQTDTGETTGPYMSIIYHHGPAINVYLSHSVYQATSMFQADLVFALPYPKWPELAEEWLTRHRPSGWPDSNLRTAIEQDGCEIVPVGQDGSPLQEFEWRLSFSHGEMKLSRSLTRVQREIVHIMKMLITELPSYNVLNIMYSESEKINPKVWVSKNLGKMFFYFIDKYLEHLNSRSLPHYFIQERNLLEKFRFPTVEDPIIGEVPTDEYMEKVLIEMHELRKNLLERILKQNRNLSLKEALLRRVFEPFVIQIKEKGIKVNKRVYVDTLLRLAKAHVHSYFRYDGNLTLAYVYSLDALKLLNKLFPRKQTIPSEYTDTFLTAAVCSYFQGEYDQSFDIIKQLEPSFLDVNENPIEHKTYQPFIYERQTNFMTLYARMLFVAAMKSSFKDQESMKKARKLYKAATDATIRFVPFLDRINFHMLIGEKEEADILLNNLASKMAPHFQYSLENHNQRTTDDQTAESIDNKNTDEHEIIYERVPKRRKMDETDAQNENYKSREVLGQLDTAQDPHNDEAVDIVHEREQDAQQQQDMMTTQKVSNPPELTEPERLAIARLMERLDAAGGILDLDVLASRESSSSGDAEFDKEQQMKEDIDRVGQYSFERFQLALRYRNIGMETESASILSRLREYLNKEHHDGERLYGSVLHYAGSERKSLYDFEYPIPSIWEDVFQMNQKYLVYTRADMPVLDLILKLVLERSNGIIKIPHLAAAYHFKIQRLKRRGELIAAKTAVKELQDLVDNFEGDCQLLVALHWSSLNRYIESHAVFIRVALNKGDPTVQEEIPRYVDKLIDLVSKYEIRNSELEDIFIH